MKNAKKFEKGHNIVVPTFLVLDQIHYIHVNHIVLELFEMNGGNKRKNGVWLQFVRRKRTLLHASSVSYFITYYLSKQFCDFNI